MIRGVCVPSASRDDCQKAPYFQDIVATLQSVKHPGSFAAGGTVQLPFPALQINGIPEKLGLPINSMQVGKVVEKCSRAPFGREEDTIADSSVSNTWQLNPSQFSVGNQRAWKKDLKSLVDRVKTELGCGDIQDVTCELYKMLLYEPGGFFKRHQDTEKANGTFGTLVIQLPSDYSGGQLVVSHDGKEKIFDFSGMKGCTNFNYAAFYADCQHELIKVTKGYRFCLIYNLVYSGTGSLPAPMKSSLVVGQLSQAMQLWNDEASQHKGPPTMAYILKHKYCEANLSFKDLKNVDWGVGDVLAKACLEANFDFYLAHVIRREMWRASCHRKKYTLAELNDDSIDASHFISPQGQKPAYFSKMSLDDGAVVPKERYKLDKPDAEECSEATGNEGASVERWYKWTALILWPLKKRLVNIGSDKVTNMLKMPALWNPTLLTAAEKENNLKFARELVESDGHSASSAVMLLQCLRDLGQTELIHKFLSGDISEFLQNVDFRKEAFNLCDSCVGWEVINPSLWALMNDNQYFTTCCGPLTDLVAISLRNPSAAQPKSLCMELATAFVKTASSKGKYDSHSEDVGISMLKVLLNLGDAALVSKFLLFLANASYEHHTNISIFLRSQPFVEQLLAIGKALGWETLKIGLMILFKDIAPANISKYCDFLCRLVCYDDLTPQKQLVCRNLMDIIIDIVIMEQDFDPRALNHHILHCGTSLDFKQDEEHRAANSTRRPDFVSSVLTILIALEYNKVKTESVINAFVRQPNRYPVGFVILPALEYLRLCLHDFNNTTFISIVTRFISVVQGWIIPSDPSASNPNASPPISWSRNVTIECVGYCDDCKMLQGFLRDPVNNHVQYRINHRRRSHLEKQLNILKCGTTHFTDPRGSPQTLVIFKLGQQFQERNQLTQQDDPLMILGRLYALCPPNLGGAPVAAIPQSKKQKVDTGGPSNATGAPHH